ncbi:hypothetical protein LINPERPRIM_LOCUS22563 [Linum perenne]
MYNHASVSPRCTLKVDLIKAFDSVHWDYLLNMLLAMKFPVKFIDWLKACIFSASWKFARVFSSKERGSSRRSIVPYLFVIAIEGLSCLLDIAGVSRQLPFHP